MLLLDPRVGSGDLAPILTSLGCSVAVSHLEFADAAWIGNGPEGAPILCGIEIKKLNDILGCIVSGRFSGHQLIGMVDTYDELWLLIEGLWRPNPEDGVLETWAWDKKKKKMCWMPVTLGNRTWMYRDFEAFLTTAEIKGGIRLRRTADRNETARVVAQLYKWWTNGEFEEHTSHIAIDQSTQLALQTLVAKTRKTASLYPGRPASIPLVRRLAAELPGIGVKMSGAVAGHFESVRAMVNAGVDDWTAIRGIGTVIAQRVVTEVNREI